MRLEMLEQGSARERDSTVCSARGAAGVDASK
jgi:hypothetical protein